MADTCWDCGGFWGDDDGKENLMTRESVEGIGFFFFFTGVIIWILSLLFHFSIGKIFYGSFGLAIAFFILSTFFQKEKTKWECQQCHAILVRSQIKFGLCPHCATKVKDFRGLHRGF